MGGDRITVYIRSLFYKVTNLGVLRTFSREGIMYSSAECFENELWLKTK